MNAFMGGSTVPPSNTSPLAASLARMGIRIRIRIIYLMSGTQGVVTQSPEPGAHGTCV